MRGDKTPFNMSRGLSLLVRLMPWSELSGFIVAAAVLVHLEFRRHPEVIQNPRTLLAYSISLDITPVALMLLGAPFVWRLGKSPSPGRRPEIDSTSSEPVKGLGGCGPPDWVGWFASALLFLLSVGATWLVGQVFRGMPPAYHDEYSYVLQAKTFLAGRLYFPQHQMPEFFDQMHVLNDNGVFASRYFPGVGLWMAPWVALGLPYVGQYVAGGLAVVCVFWIGREMVMRDTRAGLWAGLLAGLYFAISPAMLVFGNLLLSHHPTVLGLTVFLLCYLRSLRSVGVGWPLAGGVGLCLAMLCRPLTAFGFALPFGIHLLWGVLWGKLERWRVRLAAAVAPLVVGLIGLGSYNAAITGSPLLSPYGLYTHIYSPWHMYGFYNVSRGRQVDAPKELESYNRWAQELTPSRAMTLMVGRWEQCAAWTLGCVSLAWFGGVLVVLLPGLSTPWRLLVAALVGLHAAYFPYAFEGIFGLSYVFESVPVLCLLAAGLCVIFGRFWRQQGRGVRAIWLGIFLICGYLGPLCQLVQRGAEGWLDQVLFARSYYAGWDERMRRAGVQAPALIFIRNPDNVHLNLIINTPDLSGPILRAKDLGPEKNLGLAELCPDRTVWFLDAQTRQLWGGWSLPELRDFVRITSQSQEN